MAWDNPGHRLAFQVASFIERSLAATAVEACIVQARPPGHAAGQAALPYSGTLPLQQGAE